MVYRYKIKTFDVDEEHYVYSTGFCYADNYCEAIKRLSNYYGENEITSVENLTLIGDSSVVQLGSGSEDSESIEEAEKILNKYEKDFCW